MKTSDLAHSFYKCLFRNLEHITLVLKVLHELQAEIDELKIEVDKLKEKGAEKND